jgi:hypothetical protein
MPKQKLSQRPHVGNMYPRHSSFLNDELMQVMIYIERLLNTRRITLRIRITGDNTSVKIETLNSEAVNVLNYELLFKR